MIFVATEENKDFIKENKNIKTRAPKLSPVKVMAQAPSTYQRGVVPKYLRDRKEDTTVEIDAECPPGHILLPEEERKETLRVLRQSKLIKGDLKVSTEVFIAGF